MLFVYLILENEKISYDCFKILMLSVTTRFPKKINTGGRVVVLRTAVTIDFVSLNGLRKTERVFFVRDPVFTLPRILHSR